MKRRRRAAAAGVTVISAAVLALAGWSWLIAWNAWTTVRGWRADVAVVIYLQESADDATVASVTAAIETEPGVRAQRFVTQAEAEADFLRATHADRSLLEGLGDGVFPSSVEVSVDEALQTPQGMSALAAKWSQLPGVEDVRYGEALIRELSTAARVVWIFAAAIGGVLAGGVALVIGFLVDVSLHARREEISLLRLLGAAEGVIVKPFLLQGVATGALGGLLASGVLGGAWWILRVRAGSALDGIFGAWIERLVFPIGFVPLLVGLGALVGGLGTVIAVRRAQRAS